MKEGDIIRQLAAVTVLACITLSHPLPAGAAPPDIRVFTDDIAAPGKRNIELQGSLAHPASSASAASSSSGLVFQGLAELAYGLSSHWESSVQLPLSKVDGNWHGNGINGELEYIASHDRDEGFYWGGRAELGYASSPGEARAWQAELRPILGYRIAAWHFALNPTIAWGVTGENRRVRLEPSAKASYQLTGRTSVGTEYFVEAGPLSHPLPRSQRSELAFLVLDMTVRNAQVNLGVGRHMTDASDRWVVKFVASLEFD